MRFAKLNKLSLYFKSSPPWSLLSSSQKSLGKKKKKEKKPFAPKGLNKGFTVLFIPVILPDMANLFQIEAIKLSKISRRIWTNEKRRNSSNKKIIYT